MAARSPVRFPVVRDIAIDNYRLFPGTRKHPGLHHSFARGLHVIIGINGIGKTTLLTAIYRMLIGPSDPDKSDEMLGAAAHEMVTWRARDHFRRRVDDDAKKSLIRTRISFGSDELELERRLSTLSLTRLLLNGEELRADEATYQTTVTRLTGVSSFYDFWTLCRYLIFLLEDRFELVWNGRAQFEILRILFSDPTAAAATSEAQDLYLAADSQYRNDRAAFRRIDNQYTALPGAAKSREAEESIATLAAEIDDLEQQEATALTQLAEVIDARKAVTLSAELQRISVEDLRRQYESQQGVAIVRSFPKLHDTARLTFLDLVTGIGCLVCGSQADQIGRTYDKRIRRGVCPVCESSPQEQEFDVAGARNGLPALEGIRTTVTEAEEDLHAQLERQQELQQEYDALALSRAQLAADIESRRLELGLHRSVLQRNESSAEVTKRYRILFDELARSKAQLQRLFEEYNKHVVIQEARIRKLSASLRRRFEAIAQDLLAERCTLSYSADGRRVGQEANWAAFPRFSILLTSGVFSEPHERKQRFDVSESQAEFIDLAFRMALIGEAAGERSDGMVVIETPEASLDAIFATHFGKLLRSFAYKTHHNNVVITTSNLVSGPMLSELLKAPRARTKESIEQRVINLLDIAAQTAALRGNKRRYQEEYEAAMRAALER